jgi:hypothetical protein
VNRPRKTLRRSVGLTAAIGLHLLLTLALVSQTPSPPAISPTSAIELVLRPALGRPALPPVQRELHGNPGRASPAPATTAPRMPATSATPAPATPAPLAPSAVPSQSAPPQEGDNLRRALNSALGCDLPGGPRPEDRVRCAQRFATAGGPTRSFGIDPSQRAYFDAKAQQAAWWQQPVLSTIPKNGCAPLITNQQSAVTGGEVTADDRWRALPPSENWRTGGPTSSHPPTEWRSSSDWRPGVGCGLSFYNAMRRR